jgi:hypothetical protein
VQNFDLVADDCKESAKRAAAFAENELPNLGFDEGVFRRKLKAFWKSSQRSSSASNRSSHKAAVSGACSAAQR